MPRKRETATDPLAKQINQPYVTQGWESGGFLQGGTALFREVAGMQRHAGRDAA